MNIRTRFNTAAATVKNAAAGIPSKVAAGTGLALAGLNSAIAQTDPTAEIVTKITEGGTNGVKVAVAFVLAGFSIAAIYMLRRKS